MGFKVLPVPDGYIASVITHLEMFALPANRPPRPRDSLSVAYVEDPAVDWYLPLFRQIGEEWLWFSRLMLPEERLAEILSDPDNAVYVICDSGREVGLLEFNWRERPDCEISFFGLVPEAIGIGAGAWLMAEAQRLAFSQGAERLWLHTCTLDHPKALPFYIRQGFIPFKREIEYAPDPRLTGDIRPDAAAFHPVIHVRLPGA